MYSLQYRPQMDHDKSEENGGGSFATAPHFLDIGYGPSVACTVGCKKLCTAYVWPIYGLCMTYIWHIYWPDLRSVLRSDLLDVQITRVLWEKKG